jgi:CubicO group peptidase (beta-lactamase class C family)
VSAIGCLVQPDFGAVEQIVADARAAGAFPAAAIEIGRHDAVLWQWTHGRLTYADDSPPVRLDTLFDLASLTKVIATAAVAMQLVGERRLLLNAPVAFYVGDWRGQDRERVTIADLLEHCAGFVAWSDVYRRAESRREFVHEIATMPLEYAPRTRSIYSDLGFMLLGLILEEVAGRSLDELFGTRLGEHDLTFRPAKAERSRTAPTEDDRTLRGRLLAGEVHDENAWRLGGVAGHAGLFGTAPAVGRHARLVLRTLRTGTALGEPWLLRRFLQQSTVPRSSRALGWDRMRPTSSCGRRFMPAAFGHTGFTGTSLWIDPVLDLYIVLLTNRVHPQRPTDPQDGLARLRPLVHDAIVSAVRRPEL